MAQSTAQSSDIIKSFLEKTTSILASFDYDSFSEVFSKNIEYRSGPAIEYGRDAFIAKLKSQIAMVPPMSMKHVSERVDIAADGLVYAIGTSIMTFKSNPNDPVTIPVVSVYTLVPQGEPDAGKINSLTLYEDPTPIGIKLQEIMGGEK